MTNQDDLLRAFVGHYGRLCHIVARALSQGHPEAAVVRAAMGSGTIPLPVYEDLRKQRTRVDASLGEALAAQVTDKAIVDAATEVNLIAQQEWMMPLPKFSEKR